MKIRQLLFLLLAVPFLAATNCDDNAPVTPPASPVLESLEVAVDNASTAVGSTVIFTATGTLHPEDEPTASYTEDMTALVIWESSDPGILLVSPDGRATAQAAGTVSVSARTPPGDISGAGVSSSSVQVTVTP